MRPRRSPQGDQRGEGDEMNYPTEWWIQDRINSSVKGFAHAYEVHALSSSVDSLERSLRQTRAEISELRAALHTAQDAIIQLQQDLCHRMQP